MLTNHMNSSSSATTSRENRSNSSTKAAAWAWHLHSTGVPTSSPPSVCIKPQRHVHDHRHTMIENRTGCNYALQTDDLMAMVNKEAEATPKLNTASKKSASMREYSRFKVEALLQGAAAETMGAKKSLRPEESSKKSLKSLRPEESSRLEMDRKLRSSSSTWGPDHIARITDLDQCEMWDCGSSLYDAYEIVSFSNRIERSANYWLDIFGDHDHTDNHHHHKQSMIPTSKLANINDSISQLSMAPDRLSAINRNSSALPLNVVAPISKNSRNNIMLDHSTSSLCKSAPMPKQPQSRGHRHPTAWRVWLAKLGSQIGIYMKPMNSNNATKLEASSMESAVSSSDRRRNVWNTIEEELLDDDQHRLL